MDSHSMKGRVYVLTTEYLQWSSIFVFDSLAEIKIVHDSTFLSNDPIDLKAITMAFIESLHFATGCSSLSSPLPSGPGTR